MQAPDQGLLLQLECVRFLVEQRGARVNQRDVSRGWTPLHRCANMAHHTHASFLATFEYLLQRGGDAAILTEPSAAPKQATRRPAAPVHPLNPCKSARCCPGHCRVAEHCPHALHRSLSDALLCMRPCVNILISLSACRLGLLSAAGRGTFVSQHVWYTG